MVVFFCFFSHISLLPLNSFIRSTLLCTFPYLFSLLHTDTSLFCSFLELPDINECSSARACQLSERCVNTVGSFTCQRLITCPPGHQINNDICEGTPPLLSIKALSSYPQWLRCEYQQESVCMTACSQCQKSTLFRQTITFTTLGSVFFFYSSCPLIM